MVIDEVADAPCVVSELAEEPGGIARGHFSHGVFIRQRLGP